MISPEILDYFKWQIPDGSRVRLTLIQEDDLELLHQWKSQIDISYITSRAIQHLFLEERQQRFQEKIPSIFAIRRITNNHLIGEISVYNLNPKNQSAGVGYFTGTDYRQQGYTKEGLWLLLNHLLEVVGLNKVMADTGKFNQASIALLKSLGFRQDGCLRQHQLLDGVLHDQLLFSLLAEEWKEQGSVVQVEVGQNNPV
ncbi:MAG: GNAT family N-acetyltransferase [Leptolyngbyaceae cyanobacterium SM1_1_3]|nr:GNAT family N-acetyltransferase [Leptolyngbyaceae cyanobacterium SM1_1_3]NJN01871.1 GNAT family N-acetyltransferase [Leptolyngbyaceae cyanobacterium RM1_1_2]